MFLKVLIEICIIDLDFKIRSHKKYFGKFQNISEIFFIEISISEDKKKHFGNMIIIENTFSENANQIRKYCFLEIYPSENHS